LDLKTSIPAFILFTNADVHEVNALDIIVFEANSFYIMDRGYVDYKRLYKIHLCKAFFVTRAKDNMNYRRLYSHSVDKSKGVLCDQTVLLNGYYAAKDYPEKMRRIKFRDEETGKTLIFLTNNFHLAAADIAQLYKHRWKIELFFKWIKQHLKIKSFWGTSENAVRIQIYSAIISYCLVAIVGSDLKIDRSTYEILQVLGISLLDKTPVNELFEKLDCNNVKESDYKQLSLNLF
jgi:IS4 transposase